MPSKPLLTFSDIPGTGDIQVLNYALALEAAEAELYRQALLRLTTGGTINGVAVAGLGLPSSAPDVTYTAEFGTVEAQHRDFLIAALGANAITNTALAGATFDFGIASLDRQGVVDLLRTVEATGTSAYIGAVPYFATNTYLLVAGGIQSTEARHTAAITEVENYLFGTSLPTAPLAATNNGIDVGLAPNTVLAAVSGPNGFIILP